MTFEEFLARLEGVRRGGNGRATARCPAHQDRVASLSVREGDEQPVILQCFAGCTPEAILAAAGVTWQDVCKPKHERASEFGRIVAYYDYTDEQGKLLFQVCRKQPKGDFPQRRPDGKGGWIWNLDGTRRVLFRLPKVIEAATAGGVVYVAEGEKDALKLEALGLVATTNPGGAGKWRDEYAVPFHGVKGAVKLPDNDDPGRKHAQDVAASLHRHGVPVKVLELPGLPPKGDVSDWLAAGGNKPKLFELGLAAPLWEPQPRADADTAQSETTTDPEDEALWPDPIPLRSRSVPPFPVQTLPAALQSYVEALAEQTQTPPELSALVSLSVLATACSKRVEVEARPGWREPVNIFAAVVQPPGTLKSAVFMECTAPMRDFEMLERQRLAPEIKKAQARRKVAEKALERAQAEAAKAGDVDVDEALAEVERRVEELEALPVVVAPRLVCDDTTPEKLAVLMAEQGERMAVLSPEGGVFGLMAGRYTTNGMPNLDVFLKGHAGDFLTVDRIARDPVRLEAPALTVGLAVQPDVIRRLADTPEFRGRGLCARFLYAMPVSRVGSRDLPNAKPMSDLVRTKYHRLVRRLLDLQPERDGDGRARPRTLRLTPAAWARVQDFQTWLEPKLGEAGELGLLADWGAKLCGAALRIAGVFHMLEMSAADTITETTMASALDVARYLIPHAEAAFAEMGADRVTEDAEVVVACLRRAGRPSWTKRDLFTALSRSRFLKVEALDGPLGLLEAHAFIRWMPAPQDTAGSGRRPSPSFTVNPMVLDPGPPPQYPQNPHNSAAGLDSADSAVSAAGFGFCEKATEPPALDDDGAEWRP